MNIFKNDPNYALRFEGLMWDLYGVTQKAGDLFGEARQELYGTNVIPEVNQTIKNALLKALTWFICVNRNLPNITELFQYEKRISELNSQESIQMLIDEMAEAVEQIQR